MKYSPSLLLLFLVGALFSCQTHPYQNQYGDLNQPVESITETYYPVSIDRYGEVSIKEDQPFSGLKTSYNKQGWVDELTYLGPDGEVDASFYRQYDSQGRVSQEHFLSLVDSTLWVSQLQQMMGDQLLYKEYEESKPQEEVFVTLRYQNDSITRWIDNTLSVLEVRNEDLLPLEKLTYAENGERYSRETYTYEGKLLLKFEYEGPSEKDSYTYRYQYLKFDERGNWTERLKYFNKRPERITRRSIVYRNTSSSKPTKAPQ